MTMLSRQSVLRRLSLAVGQTNIGPTNTFGAGPTRPNLMQDHCVRRLELGRDSGSDQQLRRPAWRLGIVGFQSSLGLVASTSAGPSSISRKWSASVQQTVTSAVALSRSIHKKDSPIGAVFGYVANDTAG